MSSVYKIKCLHNNKVYIGSSIKPYTRYEMHKYNKKSPIYDDYRLYGDSKFQFNIIDDHIPIADRYIAEQKYIEMYDSINLGYNTNNALRDKNRESENRRLKYRNDDSYRQNLIQHLNNKYSSDSDFKNKIKESNLRRYKDNIDFNEAQKIRQKNRYRNDINFRNEMKNRSIFNRERKKMLNLSVNYEEFNMYLS